MTNDIDYRQYASSIPNCVALADHPDHSTLAVVGEHVGFVEPKFRQLSLEQVDNSPVHILTINGVSYYYADEVTATNDLDAILTSRFPVRLRSVPECEVDALLAKYATGNDTASEGGTPNE